MADVTADAIRSAHRRIPSAFRSSPQLISEPLTEAIGVPVVVKLETANPIGSFKGRGTWLAVSELVAAGRVGEREGVVVASAGNFGQGVAYAGRALGIPVLVVAATTANPTKVAAMRRLGADVRTVGRTSTQRASRPPISRLTGAGICWSTGRIPGSRSVRARSLSSSPTPWRAATCRRSIDSTYRSATEP